MLRFCNIFFFIVLIGAMGSYATQAIYANTESKSEPAITKMVSTDSYVKLTWSNGNRDGVRLHYIYRKSGKGSYKKIATVDGKKSSYVDKKIKVGTKYSYKVSNKYLIKNSISSNKTVTPIKIKAPKLVNVKTYTGSSYRASQLTWRSTKGTQYYVYRKPDDGSWERIASVKASSSSASYLDKISDKDKTYTYTCKEVRKISSVLDKFGSYEGGIKVLKGRPKLVLDCQNLKSKISWNKISGATSYKIYRKVRTTGSYRLIGTTTTTSYTDIYKKSLLTNDEKLYLCATAFVDPSINPFVYTVRAVYTKNGKESYSDYNIGGVFHIETPSIVSVTKEDETHATIEWGILKNAEEYSVFAGCYDEDGNFKKTNVGNFEQEQGVRMAKTVEIDPSHTYFTVQAKFKVDGKTVYSEFDKGFSIKDRKYQNQNILFIGDSITYGSPYKGVSTREVFSYPWRVQQLTGVKMYNPSIPGATYTYSKRKDRYRMITDVAEYIEKGKTPPTVTMRHPFDKNTQTYKDFDVVVMACGTNDYSDNAKFGNLNSTNIAEFNGAVNTIINWIKKGNEQRVAEGKAPTKIVFVELFYSDRRDNYSNLTNRFITKNGIGLTLTDYQKNLDKLSSKYRKEGLEIYDFDTTEFVDSKSCPYATSDNLHMSRYTYTQIGNKLAEHLIDNGIIK